MARKLINTKEISHEEWVELRKKSLGGSDAGTCVNMNPFSSLITLYADKKGLSKPIEDNESMRLGRDLEQYVADRYMEKTGKKVVNDNFMYAHSDYDFITANIDRRIVGENAGLECKTMGSFSGYNFEAGEVPSHYYCQCQHYMAVMDFSYMDLAILVYQRGIYVVTIERDDEFIEQLLQAEIDFWENYIEKNEIPAPDGSDASMDTLKELYPTPTPDSEIEIFGLDSLIEDYIAAAELAKEYEEKKTAIQGLICSKLGTAEVGIGENYGCSWKSQSKTSVDTKKLEAEYPEVYAQVKKVSEYRVFRKKKIKK